MLKTEKVFTFIDDVEVCFGYLNTLHLVEVTNIEKDSEMRTITKIPRNEDVDKILNGHSGVIYKKVYSGSVVIRVAVAYIMDNFGFRYGDLTEEQLMNVGRAYYYEYHCCSTMFWDESYNELIAGRLEL